MAPFILPLVMAGLLPKVGSSFKSKHSIRGVLEVKHSIKNRVRISVPSIKGTDEDIDLILSKMNEIEAIKSVKVSIATGSIVVNYDQTKIELVLVLGVIMQLTGLDAKLTHPEKSHLEKEFEMLSCSIDKSLLSFSDTKLDTKSTVTNALIAMLLVQLWANPKSLLLLPTPITLIWWLYQNNMVNKDITK